MARQNKSPLKQEGNSITDEANVIAPVKYNSFVGDFSVDASLDDARERKRTSTGLKGLELKLSKTKPGSPEHIRLSAKLDKRNFNREKKSIKKSIRKYGEDADFSNISTEFMEHLNTGGSVGDKARRTKKQVDRFLDRDQKLRGIVGVDKVDRRSVYNEGIDNRNKKIADKLEAEKKKQTEIDARITKPGILPTNSFTFPSTSSVFDRRFVLNKDQKPSWSISGSTTNPSRLTSQFNIYDSLNISFNKPLSNLEENPPQKGNALNKKRPFISHTNSVTAGKPIGSLMKKFK